MQYLLAAILFFLGYRFNKWYGFEQGKKDPNLARNIHSNEGANLLANIITLAFYAAGFILILN